MDQILRTILGSDNVYFEPPPDIIMRYPCIVYSVEDAYTIRADNRAYNNTRLYQITSITKNPDTDIIEDILNSFEKCSYDRRFKSDNLIHDVFRLYF